MNKVFLVAFAMLAVTFTGCMDLEQGESAPIATFMVEESSSGVYYATVIKVSILKDLDEFKYFLKDDSSDFGKTYTGGNGWGEIAMQNISGELHGIDMSYNGDDVGLQNRTDQVSNDDGSNYPVHFSDNDRDGMLSANDEFQIYGMGNSANGPAEDGWKLHIQFNASGDIIGMAQLL